MCDFVFTQPQIAEVACGELEPTSSTCFRLEAPYHYQWCVAQTPNQISIPAGFLYDGASVPPALWFTGIFPDGKHRAAALVHDWIYVHKGRLPAASHLRMKAEGQWLPATKVWTRKEADQLFRRMMEAAGYPWWKCALAYRSVRWFGGFYWDRPSRPVRFAQS